MGTGGQGGRGGGQRGMGWGTERRGTGIGRKVAGKLAVKQHFEVGKVAREKAEGATRKSVTLSAGI